MDSPEHMEKVYGRPAVIPPLVQALEDIQKLHTKQTIVDGRSYAEFCGHCKYQWPCDTRKLADETLGGGERG